MLLFRQSSKILFHLWGFTTEEGLNSPLITQIIAHIFLRKKFCFLGFIENRRTLCSSPRNGHMVFSHKRGHMLNGSLVISVNLHCQTWTVKCKIWIQTSMKLCLPRKEIQFIHMISLLLWRSQEDPNKISKYTKIRSERRKQFSIWWTWGCMKPVATGYVQARNKGRFEELLYKDNTDILQYSSYCNLFLRWYSKFEGRGNEDVGRLSATCLPQDNPWAMLIK